MVSSLLRLSSSLLLMGVSLQVGEVLGLSGALMIRTILSEPPLTAGYAVDGRLITVVTPMSNVIQTR